MASDNGRLCISVDVVNEVTMRIVLGFELRIKGIMFFEVAFVAPGFNCSWSEERMASRSKWDVQMPKRANVRE